MGKKRKARKIASRVHNYVNKRREDRGIHKLRGKSELSSIAERYAGKMADKDLVAHNVGHTRPQQRASGFRGVSENVAMVHDRGRSVGSIAGEAMKNWMNSKGHRENILREKSHIDGVGCWISNGKVYLCHLFAYGSHLAETMNALPGKILAARRKLTAETARYSERLLETPWAPVRALDPTWWQILPERRQRSFTLGILVALLGVWLVQQGTVPTIPATLTYGEYAIPAVTVPLVLVLVGELIRWSR